MRARTRRPAIPMAWPRSSMRSSTTRATAPTWAAPGASGSRASSPGRSRASRSRPRTHGRALHGSVPRISRVPRLSVIVPATDGSPTVGRCTAALEAGSERPAEIVVVREPAGLGAPAARNAGVAESSGDVLVFVDSDVEVAADAMERIGHAFDADPGLAALFGSYDDAPGAPGAVSAFRNLLHHHVHHASPGPAGTFWTGLGAVRREAFDDVGGFDETPDYMEDVDLGMRLAAAGHRIELDPAIQGKHLKHWGLRSMVRTDFHGRAIPWVSLLLRHRGGTGALNLGWKHRLSALA